MANSDRPVNAPALPRRNDTSHRDRRRDGPGQGTQNGSARGASLRGGRTDRGTRGRGQSNHNKTTDSNGTLRASGGRLPDHSTSAINDVVAFTSTRLGQGREAQETSRSAPDNPVEDSLDGDVCFICASTIEHTSIAPCNHQTCHICSLRMRALYKTQACAHCRTEADRVIFTDDPSRRYESFKDHEFAKIDENLGIKYEKEIILEDTILLLRYNCPDKDCDVACLGWPDLHRHVKSKHGKVMCDLCTRNKKVFTHEHELFTSGELRKHEKFGDDNPGAIDQSGFKGHPECGFCSRRFYGDDELYTHCRERHEKCHICDRRNNGRHPQYYLNYQMLEKHFEDAHFVCLDTECQANKTNVFESEIDLKAHQLTDHPNGLSKDARRETRLVDMSSFDYRTPYQPERRGGREVRGSGRGRDPNAEPLPTPSAQPIGRAELAYQRQMAIQNSQTASARNFGGQLTRTPQAAMPAPVGPQHSSTVPTVESLTLNSPSAQTPQDQARQLRHAAVLERASTLLKNDQSKISTFRTHVSSYRSSTMSATELIDAFFSLFDVLSTELGKLVRELAYIYENESKRTGLLEAWNSWRAINEDYPSLPGPAGILPGLSSNTVNSGTATSGRRVLRLKSSTAQSSRSAVSRQGSWGGALVAGGPGNSFPALGGSSGQADTQKRTPWTGGVLTATRVSPINSRPNSQPPTTRGAGADEEMFPSLPTTAKPSTLMAGLTKGTVRWDDRRSNPQPGVNPWINGGTSPTPPQAATTPSGPADEVAGVDGTTAKKKGKKGKGQVLYHFG